MPEIKLDVGGILDRTKSLYGLGADADLARFLDMSPSGIATWRRRQTIDLNLLVERCMMSPSPKTGQINLHWLITGEGEPGFEPINLFIRQAIMEATVEQLEEVEKRVIAKLQAEGVKIPRDSIDHGSDATEP